MNRSHAADVAVVGGGLAGLAAAVELADAGRRVVVVEQEATLGGQAWWSLGGLFLVDTPEQRRLRVRDSVELAWSDWVGSAGFSDAPNDLWGRRWARAYVEWAAGGMRSWLSSLGVGLFPIVGWAERGAGRAGGQGNSVPRFHIVWGTGPGVLEPFVARVWSAVASGRMQVLLRHRVDALSLRGGAVDGVSGTVLADGGTVRGAAGPAPPPADGADPSRTTAVGSFAVRADAVLVTSGGIGADHAAVRRAWPARLGSAPGALLSGVPQHVDGRGLGLAAAAGGAIVNADRMWHYVEGVADHTPVWARHGIRILPGPSSLWLDALGRRLPAPLFPGSDTLGTLAYLRTTGFDHSWFVLTSAIAERELALSGSEQNPDLTGRSLRLLAKRLGAGAPAPVEAFKQRGEDWLVRDSLPELVRAMNALGPPPGADAAAAAEVDGAEVERAIRARDGELDGADHQVAAIARARRYAGDRLMRVASPHRLLDPAAGPLLAIRLRVLTRKTLGGLQTDLAGRVLGGDGEPVPGLWAAGEVAGFGGGGVHGARSLEGTFLGGCLFTGRAAGRALAGRD